MQEETERDPMAMSCPLRIPTPPKGEKIVSARCQDRRPARTHE
jgi:hypothetical protein